MTYPPPGGHGFPQSPHHPPAVPAAKRNQRRLTIALSAIVVVLAVIVALVANQLIFEATGKAPLPSLTLRAANDSGEDPFTDSVVLTNKVQPAAPRVETAAGAGVRLVNGTAPGLYATPGTASCDAAALGNRLSANPGAARAWAAVQGIRPQDIPWYLDSLTPVVLTADTWVTNHSYSSGGARAFQSVLQSGTAVFVDAAGVPRVACACGNPLRPPAAAPIGGYRVRGDRWPGYQPRYTYKVTTNNTYVTNNTTVVQQTPPPGLSPTDVLRLIDTVTGALVATPVGDLLNLPPRPEGTPEFTVERAAATNVAVSFDDEEEATANGLAGAQRTEPASEVVDAAENNGGDPFRNDATASSGAPYASASDTGQPAPADPGAPSTGESSPSAAPETATVFDPSTSGDAIGSLTFDDDGREVTCTLPTTFATATVSPAPGSAPECARLTFRAADLTKTAVEGAVSADAARVWRVTPVGRTAPIAVVRASWQTLAAPSTSTTTTPERTTTTEDTPSPAPMPTETTPTETTTQTPRETPTPPSTGESAAPVPSS
ncbi:DUF6777 domain-containing protein [Gordonia iterans]